MNRKIVTDFSLCTGCRACQLICSTLKQGGTNPHIGLLRVVPGEQELYNEPIVCVQCANPGCARVCPVDAIQRNPLTGALEVKAGQCVGCQLCVQYCYKQVVQFDSDKRKALKCDLCGGDPACVRYCPTGALQLVSVGGEEQ